jgi:hypothetical protein
MVMDEKGHDGQNDGNNDGYRAAIPSFYHIISVGTISPTGC